MKSVMYLSVFFMFCIISTVANEKFEDLDVDEIIEDDQLFKAYADCLLDKGSCTPEAEDLKKYIQESLKTRCVKCTPKQLAKALKVIIYIVKKKPEFWEEAKAKFDPNGEYIGIYSPLLDIAGVI